MPGALLFGLVVGAVVVVLRGRPVAVTSILVSTWLLVPGGTRVPGTGLGPLFVHRVVIVAVLLTWVWRTITERQRGLFAPRGVHLAFATFLAVAAAAGVVFAPQQTLPGHNADVWMGLAEQAAFFVAILASFRACGARRSARVVCTVAGLLALLAISERALGWSYAEWLARGTVDPTGLLSLPLEARGGEVRVRGAATFALELGWIAAMLVPISLAAAMSWRPRRLPWAVPALLVLAMVLAQSRSAYAGLAIGVVVLLLGVVLDRPRQLAIVAFGALAVVAVLVQGPFQATLDRASLTGERDVRFERLPEVLEVSADRPFQGSGLGGLLARGIQVVDVSWVTTYATLGVVGVVSLAALLLAAVHATARFVRAGPGDLRAIGAASCGVAVASVVAMAAYDFVTLRGSTETLWAAVALGLVANEQLDILQVPARLRRPPLAVSGFALVGGVVAVVTVFAVPRPSSVTAVFTTVDPSIEVAALDQSFTVKVLGQTACLLVEEDAGPATVECQDHDQLLGGIGVVRVVAPTAAEAEDGLAVVEQRLAASFPASTLQVRARGTGAPAWATTAPVWMPAIGIALGSLVPVRPPSSGGTGRPGPASSPPGPTRRRTPRATAAG